MAIDKNKLSLSRLYSKARSLFLPTVASTARYVPGVAGIAAANTLVNKARPVVSSPQFKSGLQQANKYNLFANMGDALTRPVQNLPDNNAFRKVAYGLAGASELPSMVLGMGGQRNQQYLRNMSPSDNTARRVGSFAYKTAAFAPLGGAKTVGQLALQTGRNVAMGAGLGGAFTTGGALLQRRLPTGQELVSGMAQGAENSAVYPVINRATDLGIRATGQALNAIAPRVGSKVLSLTDDAIGASARGVKASRLAKYKTLPKHVVKSITREVLETPGESVYFSALDALNPEETRKYPEILKERFVGDLLGNVMFGAARGVGGTIKLPTKTEARAIAQKTNLSIEKVNAAIDQQVMRAAKELSKTTGEKTFRLRFSSDGQQVDMVMPKVDASDWTAYLQYKGIEYKLDDLGTQGGFVQGRVSKPPTTGDIQVKSQVKQGLPLLAKFDQLMSKGQTDEGLKVARQILDDPKYKDYHKAIGSVTKLSPTDPTEALKAEGWKNKNVPYGKETGELFEKSLKNGDRLRIYKNPSGEYSLSYDKRFIDDGRSFQKGTVGFDPNYLDGKYKSLDEAKKALDSYLKNIGVDSSKLTRTKKVDPVRAFFGDQAVIEKNIQPTEALKVEARKYKIIRQDGVVEVTGKPVKIANGLDTFVHEGTGGYVVSEASSGQYMATGKTAKEAINNAKKAINDIGIERVKQIISKKQLSQSQPKVDRTLLTGKQLDTPNAVLTQRGVQTPQVLPKTTVGTPVSPANVVNASPGLGSQTLPEAQLVQPKIKLQKQRISSQKPAQGQALDDIIAEGRKSIGKAGAEDKRSIKQVLNDSYTQWVDRYHPISRASKQAKVKLKSQGAELRPEYDPDYLVRRLTGAGGIADFRYNTELKPIIDGIDQAGIPKVDIDTYLAHKRMAGFAGRDIYGADPAKSKRITQALEQKYPGIKELSQQLYDYQDKGLQELVDAGFLSADVAKSMKSQNPDYAPLYRVMDEVSDYLGLPTRKTMQGKNPIMKIKGSERQIESPLESIIGNTFRQRAAIEKNRVAQSIVKLNDITDMGFTKSSEASANTITVWNNGKKEYWQVGKDIADVAKGVNEEVTNTLLKIIQAPAQLLRQGATGRNPAFMIPNVFRDQLDAGITSKYGYIPFVDYARGVAELLKKDANTKLGTQFDTTIYDSWANSGAKIDLGELSGKKSVQQLFDEKKSKKKLSDWIIGGLDVMGRYSEQPTRIGLYRKAYKKTGNELLSALESRDATVDFARMGSKMKTANSIIPFLNVGVQGFDKLIRASKNNPGKVLFNMGVYGAVPALSITAYNLSNFPEEYEEIPSYVKDDNFVIVKGRNEEGTVDYFTFPKGNILPIVTNPIQSFMEYLYGVDGKTFSELATNLISSTLPVLEAGNTPREVMVKSIGSNLPQFVKPLVEDAVNKSFYKYDAKKEAQGKESGVIVPYFMKDKPPYQQTYEFTPQMYQKIGAVLNVSPLRVKNMMEGYLAGFAKIPAQVVEMMYAMSRGEKISPNDKTVLSRFVGQTYPMSAETEEIDKQESPPLMDRLTGDVDASTSFTQYDDQPENILEKVSLAARGMTKDPKNTIKAIFTKEELRKIEGNAVILKRQEWLNKSNDKGLERDHIIPLGLGGDNSESNLQYVSKEYHDKKTKLDNKLIRQLQSGEITRQEAQKQVKEFIKNNPTKRFIIDDPIDNDVVEKKFSKSPELLTPQEIATYYSSKVEKPKSKSGYEQAIYEKDIWSQVSNINSRDSLTDAQKDEASLELLKSIGVSPQDYQYHEIAKQENDLKSMYVEEELTKMMASGMPKEDIYAWLVSQRKEVNGKVVLAPGVIDYLVDQNIISYYEGKQLKAIKVDAKTKKATTKGTKAKKVKVPALKKVPIKSIKYPKVKIVKSASGKFKAPKVKKIRIQRFKKS